MMKPICIIGVSLMVTGCSPSTQETDALTAEQAQATALELANLKAQELYGRQPFGNGQPAHLEQWRWVWTARQGYGQGDIEVTVELALDGSTNKVDLKLLHSRPPED